jgi:hypothetical protein
LATPTEKFSKSHQKYFSSKFFYAQIFSKVKVKDTQGHPRSPKVIYRHYTQMVGNWKRSWKMTLKSRSKVTQGQLKVKYRHYTQMVGNWKRSWKMTLKSRSKVTQGQLKVIYRHYTQMVGNWKRSWTVTLKSRSRSLIRSNDKICPILRGVHFRRVGGLETLYFNIPTSLLHVFMTCVHFSNAIR